MAVYGVGIVDIDYVVQRTVGGKRVSCNFYSVWKSMITRCYSENYKNRFPSYRGCTVCEEWLLFSNFKVWMEKQDWEGKHLDKDILVKGNKTYSPDFCVFVPESLNMFLLDRSRRRGKYPLGVSWHKGTGKFAARCDNPFTRQRESLGYFTCEFKAHEVWKARKHELACEYAKIQEDVRISEALRIRFI